MFFEILTLFPGMFSGVFSDSIIKRALEKKLVSINIEDIRAYSEDIKHKTVDDYPYGGDPGMLLKAQPVADAIKASRKRLKKYSPGSSSSSSSCCCQALTRRAAPSSQYMPGPAAPRPRTGRRCSSGCICAGRSAGAITHP